MSCAFCGATIPIGSKFCPQCGASADQPSHADPYFDPPRSPVTTAYGPLRTSTYAIASLLCGIGAWAFLPVLLAVAAIVTGHLARREIRESGGTIEGDWMAVVGLVLGYAQVVIGVLALIVVLVIIAIAIAANQ